MLTYLAVALSGALAGVLLCRTAYGRRVRRYEKQHALQEDDLQKLVTYQREDMARLVATQGVLQQANEDLKQFAYIASHDLKEPLRTIQNYVEILFEDFGDALEGPKAERYKRYIMQASQRAQALIGDLLRFSRAGRSLQLSTFNLGDSLQDAIAELNGSLLENCDLEVEDLPQVYGDKNMVARLFANVLSNSRKFAKKDERCRIYISAHVEGDKVRVSVKDNGIGIAPQHMGVIFDAFRRLYSQSEYPGTGIGLALCRRIVHAHGGDIWVESGGPDQGTTVLFTLPTTPDAFTPPQAHPNPPR